MNFIKEEVLNRLDFLVKFIEDYKPDFLSSYVSKLLKKLKMSMGTPQVSYNKNFSEILESYDNLSKYIELFNHILLFVIKELKITPKMLSEDRVIKIKDGFRLKSFLYPRYYMLEALIDILGRDEAIKFHKYYTTEYFHFHPFKNNPVNDLKDLYEKRTLENTEDSPWVMVHGMLTDGKYAYRNDTCLWVEVLKDFPDKELVYYTCCYGDYQAATSYYNERFILTMEHTIAQGDKYCSRVLHDTRVDWNLSHPPKVFWDNMENNP
ncbi:MAG: L-2-amino-thiazoline-4-carboxylic acid hydrolase [Candidatus Hodarchaeales archaeon]|jgi:hypothetical protein